MTSITQLGTSDVIQHLVTLIGDAPTVYLMARIGDYDTRLYDDALACLARAFPAARILPARDLWRSGPHWRAGWPAFQAAIQLGIVASTGPIGPGVARELADLANRGVPLAWFTGDAAISDGPLRTRFQVGLADRLSMARFGALRRSATACDFEPCLSKPLCNALAEWE